MDSLDFEWPPSLLFLLVLRQSCLFSELQCYLLGNWGASLSTKFKSLLLSESCACHWPWKQTNGPREKDFACEDTDIQDTLMHPPRDGGLQERGNPHSWARPHRCAAPFGGGWQCLVGMKCPLGSWETHQSPRSECAEVPGRGGASGPWACTAGVVGAAHRSALPPLPSPGGLLWEKWDKIAINLREQASFSHTGSSPLHMSEPAGCFHVMLGITVEKTVRH